MNNFLIPSAEEMESKTKDDLKDSEEAKDFVESFTVSTNEDLENAVTILKELKTKYNQIELKRTNITKPLNTVLKEINSNFKPALAALKKAEANIKKKVSDCVDIRYDARESILNVVHEAPEEKREDMLARADELVPPEVDGMTIYHRWIGELEDEGLVIQWAIEQDKRDLLMIDTTRLEKLTREADGDVKIKGWRPIKKAVVRIESKKK